MNGNDLGRALVGGLIMTAFCIFCISLLIGFGIGLLF